MNLNTTRAWPVRISFGEPRASTMYLQTSSGIVFLEMFILYEYENRIDVCMAASEVRGKTLGTRTDNYMNYGDN